MPRLAPSRRSLIATALVTATAASGLLSARAAAQRPDSLSASSAHDTAGIVQAGQARPIPVTPRLFQRQDAWKAAGFAAATATLLPLDVTLARRFHTPSATANRSLDRTARGLEWFGAGGPWIIGGGLYLTGTILRNPGLQELGWHGTEAVAVAWGTTMVLKGVLGRARPYATGDANARDFHPFGGFGSSDRQSFPSGHTTTAFAAASAVTTEARLRWPDQWWSTWLVGPVMYGGATMVGMARMYHDKHWASDVALGAAIGTFAGQKVVTYAHRHPDNFVDRLMLHASVMPTPNGGAALGFSFPTR